VLEHGSSSVAFTEYCPVLEQVFSILPPQSRITLLADRGFEHGELMRWCDHQNWTWLIRAKSDLQITLATGVTQPVSALLPPIEQAYLFPNVTVLGDLTVHLATARLSGATEPWAVLSRRPPSLQTFADYGKRFGGIEPHFKDYKSAAFDLLDSHLRDATALTGLFLLLDIATLIAVCLGTLLVQDGQRQTLDAHPERGLSFLQLGLRHLQQLRYLGKPLPPLAPLPPDHPPAACASRSKRERLELQNQFAHVTLFLA
jgi:hypothetical protein